jgi:hypothetical protein
VMGCVLDIAQIRGGHRSNCRAIDERHLILLLISL